MKRLVIYVHGKGGTADESKHYEPLFANSDVIGFDYKSEKPWDAKKEFSRFFDFHSKGYDSVILVANSIGAYFSMHALAEKNISQAFFISPIVNMEKLIIDMMMWINVKEDELRSKKEINTSFGEKLSWDYLCYVKEHPLNWNIPTHILYGKRDNLTSIETIANFAEKVGATLTIMKDGEHWFHTTEQMNFLDDWIMYFKEKKLIRIELLSAENFKLDSLDNYPRKQDVKKVYRKHNGEYILVDCVYTEDWDMEKRRSVAKDISSDDYITYLAIENDEVVGFIGLIKDLVEPYMILDLMQVSATCRGQGIGRKLFDVGKKEARKAGAEALYISACSSEETIAFYKAMGAELTDCPIKEIAEDEPYDLQMVCYV